jgi:hypothetical protein
MMHRHPKPIPFFLQQTLPLSRLETLHPTPFTDPTDRLLFDSGDRIPIRGITVILNRSLVQHKKY